ncbi:WGR domain-containing protein [bacterium]|nr:WGR domain-containing protein [bacterium]
MGWEIKNNQFFCGTSDTFFGPYLEESIWPDHDQFMITDRDRLFHQMFYKFLADNPQKRNGQLESDPRGMTDKYLEKVVGQFEENWSSLECAAEALINAAKDNQANAIDILTKLHSETDFTSKKRIKKPQKKKPWRGSKAKKKAAPKSNRISSWSRYEFKEGSSNKFWEVKKRGKTYSVRYGRIGTEGRSMNKEMESSTQAAMKVANMIDAKLKKGYQSV